MAKDHNLVQEPETNMNEPNQPINLDPAPRASMAGTKFTIFFVFVLSVAALVAAGFLFQALNIEKRERASLEASRLQLRDQVKTFKGQNEQLRAESDRMSLQLRDYANEQNTWKEQLNEVKKENTDLSEQLEDAKEQLGALSAQVTGTVSATAGGPEGIAVPSSRVVTVNRGFNFVVVNLGVQDKVQPGDTFHIKRGDTRVGEIQIEKVYDRFSAATILKEAENQSIKEGDSVLRV